MAASTAVKKKAPAPGPDAYAECRVVLDILDRIGDKWTVMVIGALAGGTLRFNAIQQAIAGLSHRMLTLTLRGLERDGLVRRTAYPTIPPRVEYALTEPGRSLIEPLRGLADWARLNRAAIKAARQRFDAEAPERG